MGSISIEQWRARIGGFKPVGCSTPNNTSGKTRSKKRHSQINLTIVVVLLVVCGELSYNVVSAPIASAADPSNNSVIGNFIRYFFIYIIFSQLIK